MTATETAAPRARFPWKLTITLLAVAALVATLALGWRALLVAWHIPGLSSEDELERLAAAERVAKYGAGVDAARRALREAYEQDSSPALARCLASVSDDPSERLALAVETLAGSFRETGFETSAGETFDASTSDPPVIRVRRGETIEISFGLHILLLPGQVGGASAELRAGPEDGPQVVGWIAVGRAPPDRVQEAYDAPTMMLAIPDEAALGLTDVCVQLRPTRETEEVELPPELRERLSRVVARFDVQPAAGGEQEDR